MVNLKEELSAYKQKYRMDTPMHRVNAILSDTFGTQQDIAEAFLRFEVKDFFRRAKLKGGATMEFDKKVPFTERKHRHSIILQICSRIIEQNEGKFFRENVYTFPDPETTKRLNRADFKVEFTKDEFNRIIRSYRSHFYNATTKKTVHDYYRALVTGARHEGGAGARWDWVIRSDGGLDSAYVHEFESYETLIKKEADEKVKEVEEKFSKTILRQQTKLTTYEEKLEAVNEELDAIQSWLAELKIKDSDEIKKLKEKLDELKKEAVV